ncbi:MULTISPECIES: hypothetical protein [unclassified Streptomyces]|uniref:hypothetical protein n=1 Tax=unclassified Streptomyces TaxID=2593676 RepID=UPI0033F5A7F7
MLVRTLAAAALLVTSLGATPAAPHSSAARVLSTVTTDGTQRCFPARVVTGKGSQTASVSTCVSLDHVFMTVTAPAECGRTKADHAACDTSGSWRMSRDGRRIAGGELGRRVQYPGPGTYDIVTTLRLTSVPRGIDFRAVHTTKATLSWPSPKPTHRIDVSPRTVRAGRTTTVTYTVTRLGAAGDSNARLGLIGKAADGVRLTSADRQCGNPLSGAYPTTHRQAHVLDCALVDIQPGRPNSVKVDVRIGRSCSSVVSKMGYWLPNGQDTYTGNMMMGPTLTCVP